MLVRLRYAAGRTDIVTGYSLAERPRKGSVPSGSAGTPWDVTLPCPGSAANGKAPRSQQRPPSRNGTPQHETAGR
jgi:hypothetical protein